MAFCIYNLLWFSSDVASEPAKEFGTGLLGRVGTGIVGTIGYVVLPTGVSTDVSRDIV